MLFAYLLVQVVDYVFDFGSELLGGLSEGVRHLLGVWEVPFDHCAHIMDNLAGIYGQFVDLGLFDRWFGFGFSQNTLRNNGWVFSKKRSTGNSIFHAHPCWLNMNESDTLICALINWNWLICIAKWGNIDALFMQLVFIGA